MRKLLQLILKLLSILTIGRYKPIVIGVTGTVGKTTTKEAILAVLDGKFTVRGNSFNFNNEIGVPMAILGLSGTGKLQWLSGILKSLWLCFGFRQKYPKILVLELAADKPGDIKYLMSIAKPFWGVVTAVGDIPVHVEFYASPSDVAKEKSELIRGLPSNGAAFLNYDDLTVLEMKELTSLETFTFGFSDKADIYASDLSYFGPRGKEILGGISLKLNYGRNFIPVRLNNAVGKPIIYSILAAAAVGVKLGVNLVEISEKLSKFKPAKSRMNLIVGIKNTLIIDDTYNASPIAMHGALETLDDFSSIAFESGFFSKKRRRVAILGDMRELGKYAIQAHQSVGNIAGEKADILITVGDAAKLIADAAGNQLMKENIFSFSTVNEAKIKIQEILEEGDLVLIKGSRAMELEKIVEEIKMLN